MDAGPPLPAVALDACTFLASKMGAKWPSCTCPKSPPHLLPCGKLPGTRILPHATLGSILFHGCAIGHDVGEALEALARDGLLTRPESTPTWDGHSDTYTSALEQERLHLRRHKQSTWTGTGCKPTAGFGLTVNSEPLHAALQPAPGQIKLRTCWRSNPVGVRTPPASRR